MGGSENYLSRVRQFGLNARWYLLFSMMSGFALGIMRLLFNLYAYSLGYDLSAIGWLVAMWPCLPSW